MRPSWRARTRCVLAGMLFCAEAAGCAATPGELCPVSTTECAGGLVCDRWRVGDARVPYRCLQGCERRSDCPGEAICQGAQLFERLETRGVCDTWGELRQGERCSSDTEDHCGPGLTCNEGLGGSRCMPACDSFSPHAEDRRCPEGMLCSETGSAFAPDSNRVCLQLCDLATREGCAQFEACLQIQHPDRGVIGVCMVSNAYACETCRGDLNCLDGMCYAPGEEPPLPWRVSDEVPPLVD